VSAAFVVVFALFVVAMVGLAIAAVRWGVRRDRRARDQAARRQGDTEGVRGDPGGGRHR
jgi:hypothetical protein